MDFVCSSDVPTLGPVIYSLAYLQNWTVTNKVIVEIDFIFAYVLVIAMYNSELFGHGLCESRAEGWHAIKGADAY